MKNPLRIAFMLSLFVWILPGCDDDTSAPSAAQVTMEGEWKGSSGNMTLDMELQQNGSEITGTGFLRYEYGAEFPTIRGIHQHPTVSLLVEWAVPGHTYSFIFNGAYVNHDSLMGSITTNDFSWGTRQMSIWRKKE